MQRLLAILLGLALTLPMAALQAAKEVDPLFRIYGQYERVSPPQPTGSPNQVEVLELFWYGCPHCYSLEPYLKRWESTKPDYVVFRRMPAVFSERWLPHATAYYTAEALGVMDKIHGPMFDAMHKYGRPINTKEQLRAFFMEQGVSEQDFDKAYDSFAVRNKVRQAMVMTNRYGINGVPAIIVNGKYRTSGTLTGNFENLIKVINTLVDEEHKAMTAAASTRDGAP
jgi:thiol:disulfide interchange protein DsbA